jgi:hypothetical protein
MTKAPEILLSHHLKTLKLPTIKRALMLAADTACKIDPEPAEVYWRLMTAKGHHHKRALCAAANRLVSRILSVPRSGQARGASARFGAGQHGLGLDPAAELLVQTRPHPPVAQGSQRR